jgi:mono/diheme cytochrome c family protein
MRRSGTVMRIFRTCIIAIAISSLAPACSESKPDPAQLALGQELYPQHCAACHGAKLFGITKYGLVPPYAPQGYKSDMPAFADRLTGAEIRAVLAYIASHWSPEVTKLRAEMIANARNR